jgi:hypothetical protein
LNEIVQYCFDTSRRDAEEQSLRRDTVAETAEDVIAEFVDLQDEAGDYVGWQK